MTTRIGTSLSGRLLVAGLSVGLASAVSLATAAADTIKVGLLAPISGPGAQIGESAQIGVELAVKKINEAGGIAGRQIELVIGDTQANPTAGVAEAKRLVEQQKVEIVAGPTYSQVTLATMPILKQSSIASFNVSGTSKLTPETAPLSFSMLINATSQAEMIVGHAVDRLGAKSVAILSDSGAQAKTAVAAMEDELKQRGTTVTAVQEYQYGAPDMTPQLLSLRNGEPDVLLLFASTGDDTGNVLKGMDEIGWKVPVSGSYGAALAGPGIKIAGAAAYENVGGINYTAWTYCEGEPLPKRIVDFVADIKAFRPDAADRLPYNYVSLWYDGLWLLKAGIEGAGSVEGPKVAAWIEQNSGSFEGINSGLNASPSNHFVIGVNNLAMVHPAKQREGGIQERIGCK